MPVATSATHPLEVDWLPIALPGRLGLTMAPGRCQTTKGGGSRWERDMHADLLRLRELGCSDLVCLLSDLERARIGVAGLPTAAIALGLAFHAHPMQSGGIIPGPSHLAAMVGSVVTAVQKGRTVVVHCAGGLGRSGLIAGCALRSMGWEADAALRALVAARGARCPETEGQREAIRRFA